MPTHAQHSNVVGVGIGVGALRIDPMKLTPLGCKHAFTRMQKLWHAHHDVMQTPIDLSGRAGCHEHVLSVLRAFEHVGPPLTTAGLADNPHVWHTPCHKYHGVAPALPPGWIGNRY